MAEKPKKTVIGSFFGRLHRSKSREVSDEKKHNTKINGHNTSIASSTSQDNVINSVSSSKSDGSLKSSEEGVAKDSPARRLMRRFSNLRASSRSRAASSESAESITKPLKPRQPGGIMKSEQDLATITTTPTSNKKNHVTFSSGAMSEMDLRFVTTRNDHVVLNGDDFGFGEKSPRGFLSETDLTSGNIEFEENVSRTPSYLRISCALNGYTRSPKNQNSETSEAVRHMGESLVERRLKMFNQPQARANEFSSPIVTQITSESKSSHSQFELSTPIQPKSTRLQAIQNLEMGNNVSTPQPIRDLISKFDSLDLCGSIKKGENADDENVEKIEPHRLIINETQEFEKDPNGNENISEKAKSSDFEDVEIGSTTTGGDENVQPENFKIALDVESDSGISGSGNFSPESSKRAAGEEEEGESVKVEEDNVEDAENQNEFMKLHNTVKDELQKKMDEASKDLENVDNLPEICADSLRAANGNAHLLVRKKFGKFAELIGKHLKPIEGDPMPVNSDDLEAFWATIEMELTGIRKEFERVEKFRNAGWNVEAVKEEEKEEIVEHKTSIVPPKKKSSNVAMSAEAKEKLEKQRQAAEARRAEMRSKMRQKMQEMQKNTTNSDGIEC